MNYAPIIIPTLSRDKHFIRLMESLRKNSWAKYTDVYVALDYPPSEKYKEGYTRIVEYLSNPFPEFANLYVVKRSHNYGAALNSRDIREYVLTRYDRFIRTDDDAEFSPNFLEYMNKCLDYYENNPNVIAVTGYSYPIRWKVENGANVTTENFSCPMWGTGFWKSKLKDVDCFITSGGLAFKDRRMLLRPFSKMTKRCQWEYMSFCMTQDISTTLASKLTDVSMRMYTAIQDKYVVVPTVSKVRNWGFDGSGLYCPDNSAAQDRTTALDFPYERQEIDQDEHFALRPEPNFPSKYVKANRRKMNVFDSIPIKAHFFINAKRLYRLLFGAK